MLAPHTYMAGFLLFLIGAATALPPGFDSAASPLPGVFPIAPTPSPIRSKQTPTTAVLAHKTFIGTGRFLQTNTVWSNKASKASLSADRKSTSIEAYTKKSTPTSIPPLGGVVSGLRQALIEAASAPVSTPGCDRSKCTVVIPVSRMVRRISLPNSLTGV